MTTRHSEKKDSAAIVRRVAVLAVRDARTAWIKANKKPTATTLRNAYRACLLAARTLRKAAAVSPRDREEILEEAMRLETARDELQAKLVRAM